MNLKAGIGWTLALAAVLAMGGCSEQEATTPVIRDLVISVYAPGRIVDDQAYLVHAPTTGLLESWLVREGAKVKEGELLARIENDNTELNQENARIRLAEVQRNLKPGSSFRQELDLAVENARLKVQDDSTTFERQASLWKQGIGSQREYEARKLALETSRKQLRSAMERQRLQLDQLRSEVETSRNLLAISANQSADFEVSSKIKGELTEHLVKEGEYVVPQQPIGRIVGGEALKLELQVDEVDIVRVEIGQEALISLDAFPDEVFKGKVTFIHSEKDEMEQSYKIEVEFERVPDRVFVGMTAEANIVVEKRAQVLLLQQSYLLEGDKVVTKSGDTLSLELGESDLEYVEVLSGLQPGTSIVRPGP